MVMTSAVGAARRLGVALALGLLSMGVGAWPFGPPGQQPPSPYGQPQPPPAQWQFRPQPQDYAQGTPPNYQPGAMPGYPPGAMQTPSYPPGIMPYQGQPPGQYPGQMPGQYPGQVQMPGQFPGQMPGQYPVQTPGQAPGQYPGQLTSQYPQQIQTRPPRLEVKVDDPDPYLQQPALVRVRLITAQNPSEANLDLPATGDALIQRLEGPTPEPRRTADRQQEIVNTFVMMVVPLRPGSLEIPPIKVVGTQRTQGGGLQRFEAVTERPISLRVRPAMSAVSPWLPLQSLDLKATIDREESLEPGQPVTLALELAAVGGTAAQLPSLEDQLSGPDLRVYREQVLTEGGLAPDGRRLVGRRIEYYTLVPQNAGRLVLPEISVPWWNTDLDQAELARLPMRTLTIGGVSGFLRSPGAFLPRDGWGLMWMPMVGLLLLLLGYWAGVLFGLRPRRRPRPASPGAVAPAVGQVSGWSESLRTVGAALQERLKPVVRRLDPAPLAARLGALLVASLPASSRFLRCVRHANQATEPVAWSARFVSQARSRLRFQGEASQPNLTRLILELRPGADPVVLTRLMQELDAALYGRQGLDFARWKHDFTRQVARGPGLWRRAARRSRIKRAALPALNPT